MHLVRRPGEIINHDGPHVMFVQRIGRCLRGPWVDVQITAHCTLVTGKTLPLVHRLRIGDKSQLGDGVVMTVTAIVGYYVKLTIA